jgi:hypothetical protein
MLQTYLKSQLSESVVWIKTEGARSCTLPSRETMHCCVGAPRGRKFKDMKRVWFWFCFFVEGQEEEGERTLELNIIKWLI